MSPIGRTAPGSAQTVTPTRLEISSLNQLQTVAKSLSQSLAAPLQTPLWIYLRGDLGAGKTTFAQFFIHALGYPGRVKSPTYALMEYYRTSGPAVLHMDLYRLADAEELAFLGLDDLLMENPIVLVEWPEKGAGFLPAAQLELRFELQADRRQLEIYDPHQLFSLS
jgi:tRNA threonylcarbamoyladenosine biosynthesis protein TsaE